MKSRIIAAVLVALMLCAILPCTAQAAGTTLDELGMTVRIPDTYTVITRDTPADDPFFATYGVTQEEFLEDMEAIDSYLEAVDDRRQYTITIRCSADIAFLAQENYRTMDGPRLPILAISLAEIYEQNGSTCLAVGTHAHPQTGFLWLIVHDSEKYTLGYATIYGGQLIYLEMESYEAFGQEQEAMMAAIVDSIRLTDDAVFADTPPSHEYTGKERELSFTVPEGWFAGETKEYENEGLKRTETIFHTENIAAPTINYTRSDVWSQIPEESRYGYTYLDFQQDILGEADIKEIIEEREASSGEIVNRTEPEVVCYGESEYYRATYEVEQTAYGLTSSIPITTLIHIQDGWLYSFTFTGDREGAYYDDFEAMLESVTYPPTSGTDTTKSPIATYPRTSSADTTKGPWEKIINAIEGLFLLGIMGLVLFWMNRRTLQRRTSGAQADAGAAADAAAEGTQSQDAQPRCPVCRTVLPDGAGTCPRCGADPTDPTTRRCATCGAPLPANRRFCSCCGADSYQTPHRDAPAASSGTDAASHDS